MIGPHKNLVTDQVQAAFKAWRDSCAAHDEAIGRRFELSATERRCLEILVNGEGTASELARAVGLTPAAVTSLVDRLEARGYVQRARHSNDRRKLALIATDTARELMGKVQDPLARADHAVLEDFSVTELWSVIRFLEASTQIRQAFTEALAAVPAVGGIRPP